MRTYLPSKNELNQAIVKFQKAQQSIGVRKLYQSIIDENKEWKISQKQFRVFFMQNFRNASPTDVKFRCDEDDEGYEIVAESIVLIDDVDSDCVLVNCVTSDVGYLA